MPEVWGRGGDRPAGRPSPGGAPGRPGRGHCPAPPPGRWCCRTGPSSPPSGCRRSQTEGSRSPDYALKNEIIFELCKSSQKSIFSDIFWLQKFCYNWKIRPKDFSFSLNSENDVSAQFSWNVFKTILEHSLLGYKNDEFASKMGLLLAYKGSFARN